MGRVKYVNPGPKLYCGDKSKLPDDYDDFGSRRDCLRKGVGVGMYVIPMTTIKEARKEQVDNVRILRKSELVKIGDRLNIDPEDDRGKAKSREKLIQEILARLRGIKRKLEKSK